MLSTFSIKTIAESVSDVCFSFQTVFLAFYYALNIFIAVAESQA